MGQTSLKRIMSLARHIKRRDGPIPRCPNCAGRSSGAPAQEVFLSDFGQALLKDGDFAEALAVLEKGQRQFPKNPQIVLAYGVACYAQRRMADAVSAFLASDPPRRHDRAALRLSGPDSGARGRPAAGGHRSLCGMGEEGAGQLPAHLSSREGSGRLVNPDAPEIETELRRSIERNGAFWESHLELGALLSRQGKWPEAARELSRSIELDPGQTESAL